MTEKLAVTPEEAAELMGVSRSHVYDLIRSGDLPSVKLGRVRRIRTDRVAEYLERIEAEQNGAPIPPPTAVHGGRAVRA